MKRFSCLVLGAIFGLGFLALPAQAEILAMLNYETKPEDSLKALKLPTGPMTRREGIAIIDVDPESANFGKIIVDIPLPPDLVAHHIFYNKDATKAYMSALGKPEMRVIDMTKNPFRVKTISLPECQVGEDVVFSGDNKTWYITCMGSNTVIVGDTATDKVKQVINTSAPYPHGIALHDGLDRMLVTSTLNAADFSNPGETISVYQTSTGKSLSDIKVSNKPSPSGVAPVEVLFVPKSDPPVAYITNMFGGSIWAATWNAAKGDFDVQEAFDLASTETGVPLELYFNPAGDRLYVTTAKPGNLHIFDIADLHAPKLLKTINTAEGAHHVAFTKDGRYAIVQNSFVNLPGMSDGSLTVVDLQKEEVIETIDTFKKNGFNPNLIVLLPEWNYLAGH